MRELFVVFFPDVPELETLRHARALVRNERPRNPSFHGAPQPKHGAGEEDRDGLLLMVYFRAFTLRDGVDCGVPRLRDPGNAYFVGRGPAGVASEGHAV
eukprot:6743483-Pyramimonas_sp.AAC.1